MLRPYYADAPKCVSHVPYTTDLDGFRLNQRDVLRHSFELTEANVLPAPRLRAIASTLTCGGIRGMTTTSNTARPTKKKTRRDVEDEERQETIILPL